MIISEVPSFFGSFKEPNESLCPSVCLWNGWRTWPGWSSICRNSWRSPWLPGGGTISVLNEMGVSPKPPINVIAWPKYWPLIGQDWSRDHNTGLWLVLVIVYKGLGRIEVRAHQGDTRVLWQMEELVRANASSESINDKWICFADLFGPQILPFFPAIHLIHPN